MQLDFFNTINHSGKALIQRKKRALSLQHKILQLFERNPSYQLTPFEVSDIMQLSVPITSYRRAMTNLTKDDKLEKLKNKKLGIYGEPNHLWTLKMV